MSKGYADYFCVRAKEGANAPISLVTGLMAGGGAANWTGSCDEQPVSIGPSGYAAAKYLFGLDAHPDGAAKSQAVNAAKVIITGNHSNIHGGGIMTNGGLILGSDPDGKVVTATPALDITGTKALLKDGAAQESGRDFHIPAEKRAQERKSARQQPMLLPGNSRFRPTCSIPRPEPIPTRSARSTTTAPASPTIRTYIQSR